LPIRVKLYYGDAAFQEPEPVDIVLSYAVLHHLPDRLDEVIPVIRRWLKPGVVFICVEPVCHLFFMEWIRQRSGISQGKLDPGERKLTSRDLDNAHFVHLERVHFH
jgi:SAM-dependent methyltransferase